MNRYNHQKPLYLPVHAIQCTVVFDSDGTTLERSFTVIRSRAAELVELLANVDFHKLVMTPVLYEFNALEDFLSLGGPLCPVGLAADTSDTVPFVSLWNTEDGHVRKLKASAYERFESEILLQVKMGDKEDEKALTRAMLPEKMRAVIAGRFEELVVVPKNQSETDEIPPSADERAVKFADMFDAVDIDQSGEIVLEELRIVLKRKGYSDDFVEHIFCHLDINKDYRIKREEFYEALKVIPSDIFSNDRALSDEHLLRYFDEFDAEKKGEVSWPQFQDALRKRGMSDKFIKSYFSQMDVDSSKVITRNEYKRCIGIRWKA